MIYFSHFHKIKQGALQKRHQQGVALLSALIITGMAITLAATLSYRQYLSIRLTSNLSELEQAYQYIHSMEDFALWALTQDAKHSTIDSLKEDWNQPIIQPIPGGHLSGQLYDLNSRINLNDLVHFRRDQQTGQFVSDVDSIQLARFKRLLALLSQPESIADTLIDWIDMDQLARSEGAESDYYLSLEKPYITANSHLASLSELRMIKGFSETITVLNNDDTIENTTNKKKRYALLNPFVSTLPPESIPININTAPAEILKALGEIDSIAIDNIITDRETAAFESVDDFISASGLVIDSTVSNGTGAGGSSTHDTKTLPENNITDPASTNIKTTTIKGQSIDVISTYFLLKGTIQIGRARLYVNTTLHRNKEGKVSIIQREFIKHIL